MTGYQRIVEVVRANPTMRAPQVLRLANVSICLYTTALVIRIRETGK